MAMNFIESAAHYGNGGSGTVSITTDWTVASNANPDTTHVGESGISFALIGNGSIALKSLSYTAERFWGFRVYLPSNLAGGSGGGIWACGSGNVQQLVYLTLESDSSLSLRVAGGGVAWNSGAASSLYLSLNTFHYIEVHIALGGSEPLTYTAGIRVDTNVWASGLTGNINGVNASGLLCNAAKMNTFSFGSQGTATAWYCDIYAVDTNTTDLNGNATTLTGYLGDVSIVPMVPDADVTTQWTGNEAGPHYALVDEIPPDDDTTYVYSDTVGQIDDYNMTPITGFSGTIFGAQLLIYAKKDAEGERTIKGLVGGTAQNNIAGLEQYLSDYYLYYVFPLDTDNGTAWTPTVFNAESFGESLSS